MKDRERRRTRAEEERNERQLRRLQTLIDVVYAVLIVQVFNFLPHFTDAGTGRFDPLTIFTDQGERFVMFAIGFILIVLYWIQSNRTSGNLVSTDGKHTGLSILQLFFLLLYLYSVRFDMETQSDVLALVMQSVSLALAGFAGFAAWSYAMRHPDLISEAVTHPEAKDLRMGLLPEPLAAILTIPFAFVDGALWNLSWLSMPLFGALLRRRSRARAGGAVGRR